jgi:CheY-like chemotaxis protein
LLVEDDLQVLQVCRAMLQPMGHGVLVASDGLQVVDPVDRDGKDITPLLSDWRIREWTV